MASDSIPNTTKLDIIDRITRLESEIHTVSCFIALAPAIDMSDNLTASGLSSILTGWTERLNQLVVSLDSAT